MTNPRRAIARSSTGLGSYQWVMTKVLIYHLLRASFGQSVAVPQIVDLDVLDVVAVLRVDVILVGCAGRWRLCTSWTQGL